MAFSCSHRSPASTLYGKLRSYRQSMSSHEKLEVLWITLTLRQIDEHQDRPAPGAEGDLKDDRAQTGMGSGGMAGREGTQEEERMEE